MPKYEEHNEEEFLNVNSHWTRPPSGRFRDQTLVFEIFMVNHLVGEKLDMCIQKFWEDEIS